MKKIILPVFILLTAGILAQCASLDPAMFKKKPTARIEGVDIQSISLNDITFLFDVAIDNPYPVTIRLAGVSFDFLVEKDRVFSSKTSKEIRVRRQSSSTTPLSVTITYRELARAVSHYANRAYINCTIQGDILVKVPNLGIPDVPSSLSFPYSVKKKVPALKPKLSLKNFKLHMPTMQEVLSSLAKQGSGVDPQQAYGMLDSLLSGKSSGSQKIDPSKLDIPIKMSFDIVMKNETRARMNFTNCAYNFFMDGESLITGNTDKTYTRGSTSVIRVMNTFSSKKISSNIKEALKKNRADYKLKGQASMKLPASVKKAPLLLNFDETGGLNW
jgi:LEA14-like dessication related protein